MPHLPMSRISQVVTQGFVSSIIMVETGFMVHGLVLSAQAIMVKNWFRL
jgi:hypothetical protein